MANNAPELPLVADAEQGVMGLTQVEPSPVEETPIEFKEGYFPPAQAARASTLGLGNHGPAYYCVYPPHLLQWLSIGIEPAR